MTTEEILKNGGMEEIKKDYRTLPEQFARLAALLGGDVYYDCPEENRNRIIGHTVEGWEAGYSSLPHPEASVIEQMMGTVPREADSTEEYIAAAKCAVEAMAEANYRIWLAGVSRDQMQTLINTIMYGMEVKYNGISRSAEALAADWHELHEGEEKCWFEHH